MHVLGQDETGRLARRLREQRATLLREVAAEEADLLAIGEDRESELEERAQQERLAALLARLDDRGREALAAIAAALDRIARGDYGRCGGCGAPIPRARLDAVPATPWCVRCAGRRERGRPARPRSLPARRRGRVFDVSLLDDEDVVRLIRAEIGRRQDVDARALAIGCVRGVVQLDGDLPSVRAHDAVREVIADVVGDAVVDRIQIGPIAWRRRA